MFFIVLGVFIGQMLLLSTKINFLLPTNKVSIIKRGGMIMNQKMIDHQSNDLNDLIGSEFSIDDDDMKVNVFNTNFIKTYFSDYN